MPNSCRLCLECFLSPPSRSLACLAALIPYFPRSSSKFSSVSVPHLQSYAESTRLACRRIIHSGSWQLLRFATSVNCINNLTSDFPENLGVCSCVVLIGSWLSANLESRVSMVFCFWVVCGLSRICLSTWICPCSLFCTASCCCRDELVSEMNLLISSSSWALFCLR